MRKLKVVHHREKCIGCHACVVTAPHSWTINPEDGKSDLIGAKEKKGLFIAEIFPQDEEDNKAAAEACPMNIIRFE